MSSMMRLVSLSARAVTRSDSRKTAANGQRAAAATLPAVAVPILSSAALDKLAAACRRHHSTHAATRVVSPVASPKLMSPVVSQASSPRMTPVQSRAPSRRNSLSCGVCGVGVRFVGGGSRIIAPFMPSSFSSRGIHARGGGGTHPEQQQHTGEHVRVKEKEHQQQRQGTIPVVLTPQQAAEEMARSQGRTTAGARPVINVVITEEAGESAASRVIKNMGLSDFLTRIYRTTGLSVGLTLLGSWGLSLVLPPAMFMPSLVGGLVVSLGSMFAMFKSTPPTMLVPGQPSTGNKLTTVNTPGRQAAFATFVAANAFMLTPLVAMCNALHPLIVPVSAVGAGLVMAGASYVAFKRPSGSLLSLTGPLVGALGGAIVLQLAGVASLYFIGPNLFSSVVYSVYPYVGLGLFSVFTAVDTHTAIAEYESGKADHLMHAVSFYLNFVNLFASLARIISDMLRE